MAATRRDNCAACGAPFLPWEPDGSGGPLLWFCSEHCRRRSYEAALAIEHKPDAKLPAGSRYCLCRACGRHFKSPHAFEQHRLGDMAARRCASSQELAALGLSLSLLGYWRVASDGWRTTTTSASKRLTA